VKLGAVIKAGVGKLLEVGDGLRGILVVQFGAHCAAIGFDRCEFGHRCGKRIERE
jgi:hypothetical protein